MRLLVALLLLAVSSVVAAENVAVVVRSGGEVFKSVSGVDPVLLKRRDGLQEGDTITTGIGGYITLKFTDQSVVDIAESSQLTITRFRASPGPQGKKIILELLSGQLRSVTGALAKDPDAFNLRTAHASIGVRGTEFEVVIISPTETQILRHDGTVLVRNVLTASDTIELATNNAIASVKKNQRPQFIKKLSVPAMGKLPATLFEEAISFSVPPLAIIVPIIAPAVPIIVPLSSDGATASSADATGSEPIEAFVALVKNQQLQEARILADEFKDRFEGTPRFDLYHGILLMHEGSVDEAIFSFERVLVFEPEQPRARLELGHAYFLAANYARARDALNQVLAQNPPNAVQRKIKTLLTQIENAQRSAQTQSTVGATVFVGWDSNANSGSDLTGLLDPNLVGLTTLADASKPVASGYAQISANTGLIKPTSRYSVNRFNVEFTDKRYFEPGLSNSTVVTFGGQLSKQTDRLRTSLPLNSSLSWVDNELWQLSFDTQYSHQYRVWGPLWAGVKIGTQVNAAISSVNTSSVKDMAGLVLDAQERGRSHTFSTLYLQTMRSGQDDEHLEWQGIANRYQLVWDLPWELQGITSLEHQWHRYKADDLFFTENAITTDLKRRQDQIINVQLQGVWTPENWLKSQTQISWEWVESNINAYGRKRLVISQAINIQF